MISIAGIPPSLFQLDEHGWTPGFADATGKTVSNPTITASTKVFITAGQSHISNISAAGTASYTPANITKIFNLNPYTGTVYQAKDALLGPSGSVLNSGWEAGWMCRLGDKLIAAGKYTQVVYIPVAVSGTSILDWVTSGIANQRLRVALAWARLKGWSPDILFQIGTTDKINGMDQPTYQANAQALINSSYELGFTGRWMTAVDTTWDGTTSAAIRAAQAAIWNGTTILQGPDCDIAIADLQHYNAAENDTIAGLWSTAIQARM